MLLAVAAEFRAVDAAALSFRLDEHARVMFDAAAARDGGATSHRLAALLTDELRFRTDESSIEGLWLDRVLDRRAGHPLALAVLAAEIGRRAGLAGRRVLDADRLVRRHRRARTAVAHRPGARSRPHARPARSAATAATRSRSPR